MLTLQASPVSSTLSKPSETHLRMSVGMFSDKQSAQYTGKQPGEGSVVASRDTASAEGEVHAPDHTHRKSTRLKEMSDGGKGETEKGKQSAT